MSVKQNIIDLQEQIRSLEQEMKHLQGQELENALDRYTRMNHTFEQLDGYAFKSQITGILKVLLSWLLFCPENIGHVRQ